MNEREDLRSAADERDALADLQRHGLGRQRERADPRHVIGSVGFEHDEPLAAPRDDAERARGLDLVGITPHRHARDFDRVALFPTDVGERRDHGQEGQECSERAAVHGESFRLDVAPDATGAAASIPCRFQTRTATQKVETGSFMHPRGLPRVAIDGPREVRRSFWGLQSGFLSDRGDGAARKDRTSGD